MIALRALIARNCKLFFRDKGTFLPALLSPFILLFLFIAFLGNIYRDTVRSAAGDFSLTGWQVESVAAGWLLSSLIAVSAVTVAFTANTIMVQDKVSGQTADFAVSPVRRAHVALAYFLSTYLVTLAICGAALAAGLIFMAIAGWHLSAADFFLTLLDTALLALFGTALSSVVCRFVRSQGGVVGIQATVSAAYGFLCGAYMPLSSMAEWLRNVLMFLPGTYGTGLLHAHLMGGAIGALDIPEPFKAGMREGFDCTLEFFGATVPAWACYLVIALASLLLLAVLFLCYFKRRGRRERGEPREKKGA